MNDISGQELETEWISWKQKYSHNFTSEEEPTKRKTWEKCFRMVKNHNDNQGRRSSYRLQLHKHAAEEPIFSSTSGDVNKTTSNLRQTPRKPTLKRLKLVGVAIGKDWPKEPIFSLTSGDVNKTTSNLRKTPRKPTLKRLKISGGAISKDRPKGLRYGAGLPFFHPVLDVDHRERGLVTSAKDQGKRNNCYAFVAAGVLEAQNCKLTGQLVDLSAQQFVDCYMNRDESNGAYVYDSLVCVRESGGLATESDYPYTGQVGIFNPNIRKSVKIRNIVSFSSENSLRNFLRDEGPVAVDLKLPKNNNHFWTYEEGIFNQTLKEGEEFVGHGVLVVGYGTKQGKDYWIIKNSWGESWGENGFGYIERNKGICEIGSNCVIAYVEP